MVRARLGQRDVDFVCAFDAERDRVHCAVDGAGAQHHQAARRDATDEIRLALYDTTRELFGRAIAAAGRVYVFFDRAAHQSQRGQMVQFADAQDGRERAANSEKLFASRSRKPATYGDHARAAGLKQRKPGANPQNRAQQSAACDGRNLRAERQSDFPRCRRRPRPAEQRDELSRATVARPNRQRRRRRHAGLSQHVRPVFTRRCRCAGKQQCAGHCTAGRPQDCRTVGRNRTICCDLQPIASKSTPVSHKRANDAWLADVVCAVHRHVDGD